MRQQPIGETAAQRLVALVAAYLQQLNVPADEHPTGRSCRCPRAPRRERDEGERA